MILALTVISLEETYQSIQFFPRNSSSRTGFLIVAKGVLNEYYFFFLPKLLCRTLTVRFQLVALYNTQYFAFIEKFVKTQLELDKFARISNQLKNSLSSDQSSDAFYRIQSYQLNFFKKIPNIGKKMLQKVSHKSWKSILIDKKNI